MAVPRCLLTVHAHPDDESVSGTGTVRRYATEGVRTVLVCCTDGGRGLNLNPDFGPVGERSDIVEIRRRELAAAAVIVGYGEVVRLDYPDSGPVARPERSASSFTRAPLTEAVGRVVEVIRRTRPQVIVTYADDQRAYPHPDHRRAHEATVRAFTMAADPAAYPEAGPAWQPRKLYFTVTSRETRQAINEKYARLRLAPPFGAGGSPGLQGRGAVDLAPARDRVTTVIDVAAQAGVWIEAMRAHQSQLSPKLAKTLSIPADSIPDVFGFEEYILACDLTGRGGANGSEADLFAGVA